MSARWLVLAWGLLPLPAQAAQDRVLLDPISTVSVAVVGDLALGERSLVFADGVDVELEAVPTAGQDPTLHLYRIVPPRPLAPVHPNTICAPERAVTFVGVADPPNDPGLPTWQADEYKVAFYDGKQPPVIAGLRDAAVGDDLCVWGAWAAVQR